MLKINLLRAIVFILLGIIFIFSCQRDDICDDAITPNLKVDFYEVTSNGNQIPFIQDTTIIGGIGNDSILFSGTQVDEISLPLKLDEDSTQYEISFGVSKNIILNIKYEREIVFVTKACGFKVIFKNFEITETTGKEGTIFVSMQKTTNNIEDEIQSHFKIRFNSNN